MARSAVRPSSPTTQTYDALNRAYDSFNARLFAARLPRCLITMQRQKGSRGYFAGGKFVTRDGQVVTDEIALNPKHFLERTTKEVLSTLVHEMTHLEQHHFGKPSRSGYHNKEWAELMRAVGLIPSDTGEPGGKDVGQRVTHYIEIGGKFDRACNSLIDVGLRLDYADRVAENKTTTAGKAASKTKHTCATCGANAWATATTKLKCGDCDALMVVATEAAL